MMFVPREKYLDELSRFKDEDLIKVVTGVRRCGKSTLLDMMRERLVQQGVPESRIVSMKMESMEFDGITDYRDLYSCITEKIRGIDRPYIFLDELQDVQGWEKTVNALRVDFDCDIYITGSNAYLLSSELSTLLSGRYVEIEMLPLTFAEYLNFRGVALGNREQSDLAFFPGGEAVTLASLFAQYRRFGGLPFLALQEPDQEKHRSYCKSLYDTVMVRDILERDRRRRQRKLTNPALLERVCGFLADNVGNENSVNSIAAAIRAEKLQAANDTVEAYLSALCEAYLFYPVRRYDIKGKQHLKTNGKHYAVDSGIRNYLQDYRDSDQGRVLENIVYLQLRYEGWQVSVGKLRNGEVDFVAHRGRERIYVQVTENMGDEGTRKRELAPLLSIRDAYPKTVVVAQGSYPVDIDGVRVVNAVDFLLGRR